MPIIGTQGSQISGHLAVVPSAPTIGTATRTNNSTVSLTFTANSNGGSAITSYTATSSIAVSVSGTSSPLTITGSFVYGTSYSFTIAAVNAIGASASSGSSNSVAVVTYSLGDAAPGGGTIFYDAGSVLSWGRYIEAAPATWYDGSTVDKAFQWSDNNYSGSNVSGTSSAIGTGLANSVLIINQGNNSTPVQSCMPEARNYRGNSKADWFVGSYNEIVALYNGRGYIGSYSSTNPSRYASSTQYNATDAYAYSFYNAAEYIAPKTGASLKVRPLRYI